MPFLYCKLYSHRRKFSMPCKINDACSSSRSVASNQERMVPFLAYTKKGYSLERIKRDKDNWLSLAARFFRLVLRKSLEACFKVKAISTCGNEQSSFFKWTTLY